MRTCTVCGGAIGEPGVLYGYAGKWCECWKDKYGDLSQEELIQLAIKELKKMKKKFDKAIALSLL